MSHLIIPYDFSTASCTAFMITLLLLVAPETASTFVDWLSTIRREMIGSAFLPSVRGERSL
jgi:hypothetical protein